MKAATDTPSGTVAALCAQWRMIASASLRPCRDGKGFEAEVRLDPIVLKGSLEQQCYPRTPTAATKVEERRRVALEQCVRRVNQRLPEDARIRAFTVVGGDGA